MRKSRRHRGIAVPVASFLAVAGLSSCSDPVALEACSPRVPVAVVTQTIREQSTLVGDSEAARLVGSLGDTLEILAAAEAGASGDVATAMEVVSAALASLSNALVQVDFDLVAALEDPAVLEAMDAVESDEVAAANLLMESYFFSECGPESLLLEDPTVSTLPIPTFLVPEEDEPLTSQPDVDTAGDALARIVAEQFGLTLDAEQLACLGDRLEDPPDVGDDATAEELDLVFRRLFRACRIDVALP